VFYLTRFVLSLRLPDLPLSVPEWYLPLTGAVWAAACLAIGIGLWRGSRTAYRLLHWAAPLYLAWYWIDRVVFVRSDFAQRSLPAALLMTIAAAGVITLVLRRRSVRSYFAEASDG
jgi:hypothetical protein